MGWRWTGWRPLAWWLGLSWPLWAVAEQPFFPVWITETHWVAVRRADAVREPVAHERVWDVRVAMRQGNEVQLMGQWALDVDCDAPEAPLRQTDGQPWVVFGRERSLGALSAPWPDRAVWVFACDDQDVPDAQRSERVLKSAGLRDLRTWRCLLQDGEGRQHGVVELAVSSTQLAVRYNDKWVSNGTWDSRYLAFAMDGVEIRFVPASGSLRLVRRADMQRMGFSTCTLWVQPGAPAAPGGAW